MIYNSLSYSHGSCNEGIRSYLFDFIIDCDSEEKLFLKLNNRNHHLLLIIKNLKISDSNLSLAARLFYRIDMITNATDYFLAQMREVSTVLRNRGLLNIEQEMNVYFVDRSDEYPQRCIAQAHKSILITELSHFNDMKIWERPGRTVIEVQTENVSYEAYKVVIDYLYLSDEKRQTFISTLDLELIPQILQLACYWKLTDLNKQCDTELCHYLSCYEVKFNSDDRKEGGISFDWLTLAENHQAPMLLMLLKFIGKVANKDNINHIIDQMNDPPVATQLALKCNDEEIKLFATLKTGFGSICNIYLHSFGKLEWEKYYGTIKDEHAPPVPEALLRKLEEPDPWDPKKLVKDSHTLFLVPQEVNGEKLTFSYIKELAGNPKTGQKINFDCAYSSMTYAILEKMEGLSVDKSHWVLLTNDVVPGTRSELYSNNKKLVEEKGYEVPGVFDAILGNMTHYVRSGKWIYGPGDPDWTYTRCREVVWNQNIQVTGLKSNTLGIYCHPTISIIFGTAGSLVSDSDTIRSLT